MQQLYRKIFRAGAELDDQIDKFRQLRDSYVIANSAMRARYAGNEAATDESRALPGA